MKYKEIVESIDVISPSMAKNKNMFGPVYHGSSQERLNQINQDGFKIYRTFDGEVHGYGMSNYAHGKPPPVHHLGFAVYFTTTKSIAKQYNLNTTRGLYEYYLDIPNLEIINFGSPNTMMSWWVANGYDFDWNNIPENKRNFSSKEALAERHRATLVMTDYLQSKYDAVWFKGKGLRKLLDGDQIAVFDPSRIYRVDNKLATGWEIGATVIANFVEPTDSRYGVEIDNNGAKWWTNAETGYRLKYFPPKNVKGTIIDQRSVNPEFFNGHDISYTVKWKKGGTHFNYTKDNLILV
ncbi:MAG: hypothetical protein WC284_16510 [Candidimonas sp.]